ncbi:MAG: GumC family protein [Sphingomonas sp.]
MPSDGIHDQRSATPLLLQYWVMLRRRRWLILGALALALAAGVVVTLLTPFSYTATSRVEISRDKKNITNVQGLESADAGRDLEFYDTQYALLKANSLAQRITRSLGLAQKDEFFNAHGIRLDATKFGVSGAGRLSREQLAEREKAAVKTLLNNVDVSPVRKSSLVAIAYTSRSPELSARIANSWAQNYIDASVARQFASTADARKFLEGRLELLRARVEQSERDAVNYASQKGIITLSAARDAQGKTTSERTLVAADLEALNTALAESTAHRIEAESMAAAGSSSDASPEALSNTAISDLRRRRAELAAEYAKIQVQFEPGYPAALAINEQIKSLDQAIKREISRIGAGRDQAYREATRREQELRAQVNLYKQRLDSQARDSIQYNIFRREADTNRQLYDALLQRYKEIGVSGLVGASNIAIIDSAEAPDTPSAPSLPQNLGIALLLGAGLALLAAFAAEQIDEGLRDPSQVPVLFDLPLIGYVPVTANDGDADADAIALMDDAKSTLAEAYFSVRSNLAFVTPHGVPTSIMVTSTSAAEGKSTTALALAITIGRTGKRVLLIDADMRSPSLHQYIGCENAAGLTNLLAGSNDIDGIVIDTRHRGVSLMTAGPMPPSAAELLSTDRMATMVKAMLHDFDHVIIDSPPVLGLADALLIGRAVEGCLFVIQSATVPVRGIRTALQRLRSVNARLFGAVVTKLKLSDSGYGYGARYGYGYGYGATQPKAGETA